MEIWLFFAAMITFVLLHVLFSFSRTRRVQAFLRDDTGVAKKSIRLTIFFSVLILLFLSIVVLAGFLYPSGTRFYVQLPFMQLSLLKYTGLFFIKFSLIWVLVSGFQMERALEAMEQVISIQKVVKMEVVSSAGVLLFCAGVFLYYPNLATLLLLLISLGLLFLNKNYSRKAA